MESPHNLSRYTILDSLLEGCQVLGFDWRYLYVNDAAAVHGRRTREELLGGVITDLYPGIEQTPVFAELRRCMNARATGRLENEFTFPDGSVGWFELRIEPVPEGLFVLSLDITARKHADKSMEQQIEDLRRAHRELQLSYDSTIEGWASALELRDKETSHHTHRVVELTLELARAAGIGDAELVHVRRGAMLHDIGKMAIPDAILRKQDKLTDEELEVMKQHPTFAYQLLYPIEYLRPALDIPHCHHERWDGTGYPRGLKGEAIPFAARLFAVVDVWDATRSQRPYRESWSDERARLYLQELAGTHLDPAAVDLFLRVMDAKASRAAEPSA